MAQPTDKAIEKIETPTNFRKNNKQWIKVLIAENCNIPNGEALSELIYTVIEGLISRFLVDGFDETLAINMKNSINQLFNIHQQNMRT